MSQTFRDPSKWIIRKLSDGHWAVYPTVGSFWGRSFYAGTGAEAIDNFRQQTGHTLIQVRGCF